MLLARLLPWILLAALPGAAAAQLLGEVGDSPAAAQETLVQRWKVGMTISALGGPCAGLYGTAAVPADWPEQQVRIVDEDVSPQVRRVSYRTLPGNVKQMVVQIPRLQPGETAKALITFEIVRRPTPPPPDPAQLVAPERPPREAAIHLGPSPLIESRDAAIRNQANDIVGDEPSAWRRVERLYDWVREHINQRGGRIVGALAALRSGDGTYEDLTSLFIAFCRSQRIPARTVWIPDDCYAEFYLEDNEGRGYWIPCKLTGERQFGAVKELRPILQKGDNVKTPEKREPQRYVGEFLRGRTGRGMGRPQVAFVRELLPAAP